LLALFSDSVFLLVSRVVFSRPCTGVSKQKRCDLYNPETTTTKFIRFISLYCCLFLNSSTVVITSGNYSQFNGGVSYLRSYIFFPVEFVLVFTQFNLANTSCFKNLLLCDRIILRDLDPLCETVYGFTKRVFSIKRQAVYMHCNFFR